MHGLINRAVQCFVQDSYGAQKWIEVTRIAGVDFIEFEAMLTYDDALTHQIIEGAATALNRSRADLMEDIGTYLVSHPNVEALRRLLRFGGLTFVDFLFSLDELHDRARLAVADLELPRIELYDHSAQSFTLRCQTGIPDFSHLLIGVLRAMADDYGALVVLQHGQATTEFETLSVTLIEADFAEGRQFQLGAMA